MEITRMPTRLKSMGILYFWLCWDNKYIVPIIFATGDNIFLSCPSIYADRVARTLPVKFK